MVKIKGNISKKEHKKDQRANNRMSTDKSKCIKKKFTRKIKKTNIKNIRSPSISHLNIDSHFIYDFDCIDKILSKINNYKLYFLNNKI